MNGHDIIVIGASAGGVEALRALVRGLPKDLEAAVFAVLHLPPNAPSVLPSILTRAGSLPAEHPRDDDPIRKGRIYVAPPNFHLLVKPGRIRLTRGPLENGTRPAVDPLFRTAARAYGPRVIAVVLSGSLDDGTAGAMVVKERGGVVVVQHLEDALYAEMPRNTMESVEVDHVMAASELGELLEKLVSTPAQPDIRNPGEVDVVEPDTQLDPAERTREPFSGVASDAWPETFTCPSCNGPLRTEVDSPIPQYRCRIGHAWTAQSLLGNQGDAIENALWSAIRVLEERALLCRRMLERARRKNQYRTTARFEEQAREAEQRAQLLRDVLARGTAALIGEGSLASSTDEIEDPGFEAGRGIV